MKLLIISAEIQVREFWGRLLVGLYAAEKGYSVVIGQQKTLFKRLKEFPSGVFFLKSIARTDVPNLLRKKNLGHRIVSIDEEGMACFEMKRYSSVRFSEESLRLVEKVFCWGSVERNILTSSYPAYENKFVVTGNPRLECWCHPIRQVYKKKAEILQKKYGNYIFVPSNFSGLFHGNGPDKVVNQLTNLGIVRTSGELAELKTSLEHREFARRKFENAIRNLANFFPVVLRPHPTESVGRWQQSLGKIDRVSVVYDDMEVAPWILGAKAVIHHGCTTAIEALLMGKQTIAYLPNFNEKYDANIGNKWSEQATNYDALFRALSHDSDKDATAISYSELNKICVGDGTGAAERIVAEIESLPPVDSGGVDVAHFLDKMVTAYRFSSLKQCVKRMVAGSHKRKTGQQSDGYRKSPEWKGLSVGEVRRFVRDVSQILGRFHGIRIRAIGDNLFCLTKAK